MSSPPSPLFNPFIVPAYLEPSASPDLEPSASPSIPPAPISPPPPPPPPLMPVTTRNSSSRNSTPSLSHQASSRTATRSARPVASRQAIQTIDLTQSSPPQPPPPAKRAKTSATSAVALPAPDEEDEDEEDVDEDKEADVEGKVIGDAVETQRVDKSKKLAGYTCVVCMEDEPENLSVTPCGHMFCHFCLHGAIKASAQPPHKLQGRCPVCRGKLTLKDVVVLEIKKQSKGKGKAV